MHGNYVRRYWGTSPIGSRRTKPPINTPDAGVTGAGGSGGRGRASRSTTPSLPPLVWRSHGRPGPTVPRKPAAPQVPTRRSNGGRAERRPTQREGRYTRYEAPHPARGAAPVTRRCTRYGARHPIRRGALPTDRVRTQSQEQTRNPRDDHRHTPGPGSSLSLMRFCAGGNATRTRPRELALPGPQHTAISQRSTWRRRGRRRR